jgi:alkylhydroperoxidase/carboxymuconolactone decarboxylase family protein YurZ
MTDRKSAPETDIPEDPPARMNSKTRRSLGKRKDIASLALVNEATTQAYHEVYKVVFGRGKLDRKTKELMAIGVAFSVNAATVVDRADMAAATLELDED